VRVIADDPRDRSRYFWSQAMECVPATTTASAESAALDLGVFVRGAAHDIANPLNAIAMNAELVKLLLEREQPARAREALDRLLEDCARCGRLIQGMQRFGSGLHAGPRHAVAVRTLIDAAIDLVRQERAAALPSFHCDGVDAKVLVDAPALERCIAGVLHNAAEAQADTIQISIREDAAVVIEIRDNGAGIAAGAHAKVVEPFYSTRRSNGNSGLGLTLVRELLRTHGGKLHITGNSPHGTCVELRLPLASGQDANAPA
jgi:two-component system C4-dicarboxylate transport sensor histidine kinase DctB